MDNDALIEAVRKHQVLYDKSDDGYSNRVLITHKWKEVAEEVGIDEATAKKKWSVLRDSFKKHHKKETTFKSGSGAKNTTKKWYLYNQLLFLIPFVGGHNTTTTSSNTVAEEQRMNEESSQQQDEAQQESYFHLEQKLEDSLLLPCSPVFSHSQPGTSGARSANKRKRTNSQERQCCVSPFEPVPTSSTPSESPSVSKNTNRRKKLFPQHSRRCSCSVPSSEFDYIEIMLNALKGMQQSQLLQQRKSIVDDDEHFLLSLVPVMKALDSVSKFELRGELNATALRYLRRARQPVQYPGRTPTPDLQLQSPMSPSQE